MVAAGPNVPFVLCRLDADVEQNRPHSIFAVIRQPVRFRFCLHGAVFHHDELFLEWPPAVLTVRSAPCRAGMDCGCGDSRGGFLRVPKMAAAGFRATYNSSVAAWRDCLVRPIRDRKSVV